MPETIKSAALRALVEADQVGELAGKLKEKHGWKQSLRAAHQSVLKALNSGYGFPRNFDADDLVEVLELTGIDYITPILDAARERGERARLQRQIDRLEGGDSGRQMRKVEPGEVTRRRA